MWCLQVLVLVHGTLASGQIAMVEGPWPVLDQMLPGDSEPPAHNAADVVAVGSTFLALSDER